MLKLLTLLLVVNAAVEGLDNGLALTPPMGWLSWTRFGCNTLCNQDPENCISEYLIKQMADRIAADGYKDAGYEYVCIDDCWLAGERDSKTGRLQPDPIRFPSGMKALADYVHSKGLKIGIYEDFGTKTCAGFPGSEFHMMLDAQTFSDWGIDLLKFDTCNSDAHDNKFGYPAMSLFLNKTGRPILFSCEWPYGELQQHLSSDYGPVRKYCNIWRNFWDVSDSWDSIQGIIKYYGQNNSLFINYTGPGGFFDPDMIVVGDFGLSDNQKQVQMAMWSMWSAPLIMSNDLRNIKDDDRDLLLNKRLISVNQDPLGIMATKLWEFSQVQLWIKPIIPKGSVAVTFLNMGGFGNGTPLSIDAESVGMTSSNGYNVTEVFQGQFLGVYKPDTKLNIHVNPMSVYMIICKVLS